MSAWNNIFAAMQSKGTTTTAVGQIGQGIAEYSSLKSQASGYEISGANFGLSAELIEGQLGMLNVKREQIELDSINDRVMSSQKWLSRRGTVKAGFAARGVKVDASARNDSPALIMAQMLSNIDDEARQIELGRKMRIFNEVSIPGYQIQSQASNARYQQRLAEINAKYAKRAANMALIASVANAAYGAYSGYSAPQQSYQGGKSKNMGVQ